MPELAAVRVNGTVLGFDVGSRRIGVAVGTTLVAGARPLAVIGVHASGPDWPVLDCVCRQWLPQSLIVGDPLTLAGQGQPARKYAHAFARQLRERYKLPVVLVDERSSSVEASRRFALARAQGHKRRRESQALDAMAAAVIVERWLSAPEQAFPLS